MYKFKSSTMKITYLGLLCIGFISVAASGQLKSDDLDVVHLSELKFNLRRENPYNRCDKFADSIKLELKDDNSKVETLLRVREFLRRRQSETLAQFTNNCLILLDGKQPEPIESDLSFDEQTGERYALEEQLKEAKEEIASLKHTLNAVINKLNAWKIQLILRRPILSQMALVALDCVAAVSENVPLDSLDSAFLSELKYNLRDETAPNRCGKFLSGIQDKLMDSSYGADLLKLVSKMLWNRGSANLAKFTDECFNILQGASTQPGPLPVTKVPLPSPAASNELIVKQLLNEQQALKERLREAVEENNALRSKLDITSIKLIKANYLRLDAEKDLAGCKSKLRFGLNLHLHHSLE